MKAAYLGDTSIPGPASYLAGIMTHHNIPFTYTPSETRAGEEILADDIGLYVFSDYPSVNFQKGILEKVCERISDAAGAVMFGGWESYHGLGGDYDTTPLAELLPVNMEKDDDRRNWSQLAMIRKIKDHDILSALPFNSPPGIGGYNIFTPKENSEVLLEGELYRIDASAVQPQLAQQGSFPLLVVSEQKTRRVCLATDVAPHWVGGFVDWGDSRVTVEMTGEDFIEVGSFYMEFFGNLIKWGLGIEV